MSAFRVGLVVSQDAAHCRVRVAFPDRDQMHSWWLPVVVAKTQNDKAYYLPDLGEQVVCLMDEYDEDDAVLGSIYSNADLPPSGLSVKNLHWRTEDGASFDYDREAHRLTIDGPSGASITITASGAKIEIDASGNVNLKGAGQINLGDTNLKGVARLGDAVTCPAGAGTITSASTKVYSR